MKPAHNPTKIPNIRILFVVCLLPELYISIETQIRAPPATDRKNIYAIVEVHELPRTVPRKAGPPPTRPARTRKRTSGFLTRPVKGSAIPRYY